MQRTGEIDVVVERGVLNRDAYPSHRCKVGDAIEAMRGEQSRHSARIADVAFHEGEAIAARPARHFPQASPRINNTFRQGQVLTAFALALSWGANDAQKTIGLLALGAAAATGQPFSIPPWAIAAAVSAVALGTLTSGRRLIRTLGGRFYRIRPINGLAAQLASALVIFGAARLGGPVSTTQVVSTAIMGAGAAERVNKVRWGVATNILIAWVLTIPATALLGAALLFLLRALL